jgi:hypothetical protein
MRSIVRGAILGAFVVAAAYDIGCLTRGDYLSQEPVRDIAAGLGIIGAVAAVAWAADWPEPKGADVEH